MILKLKSPFGVTGEIHVHNVTGVASILDGEGADLEGAVLDANLRICAQPEPWVQTTEKILAWAKDADVSVQVVGAPEPVVLPKGAIA